MISRRALAWILVVPVGPVAVVLAFSAELCRGIALAFYCAWNAAALTIISIRRSLGKQHTEVEK